MTLCEPELTDIDSDGDEVSVTVAQYLAFWGCDPCYDHKPRIPGDGYTFYNYSDEGNSLAYLKNKLLPAIGRQLLDTTMSRHDMQQFETIQQYVTEKIALLEAGEKVPPIVREEETFVNEMLVRITYADVRKAMQGRPFPMRLGPSDRAAFAAAVNQGIDARLQACFVPGRGDKSDNRGSVSISSESLPVLIRRLYESEDETANNLAAAIMQTLGFSDTGEWTEPA